MAVASGSRPRCTALTAVGEPGHEVEGQARGGAKVVRAAMVGAAVEEATMAEAVEAAKAMGMEATVESVVWGTVETAAKRAKRPEIVIEE